MPDVGFIELSADGVDTVRLEGGSASPPNLFFMREGIDGWYSSPDLKTGLQARGQGDGAHDVSALSVAYGTRTVEVHVAACGLDRAQTLGLWDSLRVFAHRIVRLRLVDDERDCFVEGLLSFEGPAKWERDYMEGTFSLVCPRPEILSSLEQVYQLQPSLIESNAGGLSYGPKLATWWEGEPNNSVSVLDTANLKGTKGLRYPLTYQTQEREGRANMCVLTNSGSSRAYPVFTVHGQMPQGVDLVVEGTGQWLRCTQPVYGEPLVLDCRSRTATIGGVDVSRTLTSRGFPVVEPHGSLAVTLRTTGSGWVDVSVRDTWI